MSFSAFEGSRAGGQPIQLFKFVYGPDPSNYYAYTDHTEAVTLYEGTEDEITYAPVPIERDSIEADGTLDRSALKINTDIGTALAEIFRVYPPANVVSLIIRAGHLGDPDEEFLVVWAGRIVGAQREGSQLALSGEPVSTSLRRPGLRRNYQYGCPHVLYGPQCRADKASKTVSATVSSIAGASVTLDSGWEGSFDGAKFLGGMIEWVNGDGLTDRRTILRVTGNVLSLSGIVPDIAAGDSVDVVLGCNHRPFANADGDCEAVHENLPNFGGQPWIPLKNTFGNFNHYW